MYFHPSGVFGVWPTISQERRTSYIKFVFSDVLFRRVALCRDLNPADTHITFLAPSFFGGQITFTFGGIRLGLMDAALLPKVFYTSGLTLLPVYGRCLLQADALFQAGVPAIEHGQQAKHYKELLRGRPAPRAALQGEVPMAVLEDSYRYWQI